MGQQGTGHWALGTLGAAELALVGGARLLLLNQEHLLSCGPGPGPGGAQLIPPLQCGNV